MPQFMPKIGHAAVDEAVQGLQHEAVAAERDDDVGLFGRDGLVPLPRRTKPPAPPRCRRRRRQSCDAATEGDLVRAGSIPAAGRIAQHPRAQVCAIIWPALCSRRQVSKCLTRKSGLAAAVCGALLFGLSARAGAGPNGRRAGEAHHSRARRGPVGRSAAAGHPSRPLRPGARRIGPSVSKGDDYRVLGASQGRPLSSGHPFGALGFLVSTDGGRAGPSFRQARTARPTSMP